MLIKKYISISSLGLLFCFSVKGQDSHFSQYDHSPLTINPALTAVDKNLQAILHHKDQWKALNGYRTDELSFEMRFDPTSWIKIKNRTALYKKKEQKGFAFGVSLFSDKAGDGNMQKLCGSVSLAYHIMLDANNRVSAGLLGGVKQRSINPAGLRYNSQYGISGAYDPTITSGEVYKSNSIIYSDYSAGICYSFGEENKYMESNDNKSFKVGFSLDHLSRPEQAYILERDSRSYMKYTLHAQTLLGIKNSSYSVGASIISLFQGKQRETTFGALLKYRMKEESKYTGIKKGMAVSLGCYYRLGDAVIPYLQYELARYAIGISYDVNLSGLQKATTGRGGLEVTLRFFNPVPFLFQKKARTKFN